MFVYIYMCVCICLLGVGWYMCVCLFKNEAFNAFHLLFFVGLLLFCGRVLSLLMKSVTTPHVSTLSGLIHNNSTPHQHNSCAGVEEGRHKMIYQKCSRWKLNSVRAQITLCLSSSKLYFDGISYCLHFPYWPFTYSQNWHICERPAENKILTRPFRALSMK